MTLPIPELGGTWTVTAWIHSLPSNVFYHTFSSVGGFLSGLSI